MDTNLESLLKLIDINNLEQFKELLEDKFSATFATKEEAYTKPSSGIPKTDLASSVQGSLGNADTALQSVSAIKNGETSVPFADNLLSWDERGGSAVLDNFSASIVRTTTGDESVNAHAGAKIIGIKSNGEFSASMLMATGFNLIDTNQLVGGVPYVLVPPCEFGTYATAVENNGLLVTDSAGNNKKVSMRFKAYSEGVPTSISDGEVCPYHDEKGLRFFLPATSGYVWASDMTADDCLHIAWSKFYSKYSEPSPRSVVDLVAVFSNFTQIDGVYKMLAASGVADDWNGNVATKRCGYSNGTWTNTRQENEGNVTYLHEQTISAMKADGAVRDRANIVQLSVNGTKVSYVDENETSDVEVIYELAEYVATSVTISNTYTPDDMGLEYIDCLGSGIITCEYQSALTDELANLPAKIKADNEEVGLVIANALTKIYEEALSGIRKTLFKSDIIDDFEHAYSNHPISARVAMLIDAKFAEDELVTAAALNTLNETKSMISAIAPAWSKQDIFTVGELRTYAGFLWKRVTVCTHAETNFDASDWIKTDIVTEFQRIV